MLSSKVVRTHDFDCKFLPNLPVLPLVGMRKVMGWESSFQNCKGHAESVSW